MLCHYAATASVIITGPIEMPAGPMQYLRVSVLGNANAAAVHANVGGFGQASGILVFAGRFIIGDSFGGLSI